MRLAKARVGGLRPMVSGTRPISCPGRHHHLHPVRVGRRVPMARLRIRPTHRDHTRLPRRQRNGDCFAGARNPLALWPGIDTGAHLRLRGAQADSPTKSRRTGSGDRWGGSGSISGQGPTTAVPSVPSVPSVSTPYPVQTPDTVQIPNIVVPTILTTTTLPCPTGTQKS